uniref:Cation channel sperm associated 4 n=1 Tax=Nothoprocta perdicaria TaxID=30464 RepID=A0A8C6Z202_NOTPE
GLGGSGAWWPRGSRHTRPGTLRLGWGGTSPHRPTHGLAVPGATRAPQPPRSRPRPRQDLWDREEYLCHVCMGRFLAHPAFKLSVAVLIITNVAVICLVLSSLQIYFSLSTAIDNIVLMVLFFEVLLNWYKGFWLYWKDGWNTFNFLIVVYLLAGPFIPPLNDPKIFHILRVMRLLQVCMLVKGLARMIQVIFKAIPNLLNIMFLLFILMLVFAMLGVILFSNTIPAHFGNLGKALYSLFVCVTQDGWLNIYQAFENEGNAVKIGGAIYFLIFLTGGTFICANLLVAVVMTSLEESLISHPKKQKQEQVDDQDAQPILEVGPVTWDKTSVFTTQEPLSTHLPNLNKKSFNNLSILLHSIQDNLRHYKEIREELNTIVEEVRAMDFNQAQEQELIMRSFLSSMDTPRSSDR